MKAWRVVKERAWVDSKCKCAQTRLVRYQISNGVLHLRRQCVQCRRVLIGSLKRNSVPDFHKLPLVTMQENVAIKTAIRESRGSYNDVLSDAWREYYDKYMRSDEWWTRRQECLDVYGSFCAFCGEASAEQVHHLHYRTLGEERWGDLMPLCKRCHASADEIRHEAVELECSRCCESFYTHPDRSVFGNDCPKCGGDAYDVLSMKD